MADTIFGTAGYDAIIGGAAPETIATDQLDVFSHSGGVIPTQTDGVMQFSLGTVPFQQDHAVFAVILDPATEQIVSIDLIWDQTMGAQSDVVIEVQAGQSVAFALLTDGANLNDFAVLDSAAFGLAEDANGAFSIIAYHSDGTAIALAGEVSLSSQPAVASAHFWDDAQTLQVGFEDQFGGNDGDRADLTFGVTLSEETALAIQPLGAMTGHDRAEGMHGADVLTGSDGNDLLVGGGAWKEWSLVDGAWRYDAANQEDMTAEDRQNLDPSNDVLVGGAGDDVLIGNRGQDDLRAGGGDDLVNAGLGHDIAMGGDGDDILNLEQGDDLGVGGAGRDIVNGGAGADVIFGDLHGENLLVAPDPNSGTFHTQWDVSQSTADGAETLRQTIETEPGQSYDFTIDLAANLAGGTAAGQVDVIWNGSVIATQSVEGAVFQTINATFVAESTEGVLEIRSIGTESDTVDATSAVATAQTQFLAHDGATTVDGFAAGQGHIYQVLDGHLHRLDGASNSYVPIGTDPGIRTNAIGYNTENDLVYGVASQVGTDTGGNPIAPADLVVYDAQGNLYRVGSVDHKDVVGDFDTQGNLWTFDISLDRITRIDVDQIANDGTVQSTDFAVDQDAFPFRLYDVTYEPELGAFIGLKGASEDGQDGMLVQIDVSNLDAGGSPIVSTFPVSGVMADGDLEPGIPKGAFGAAFSDADGNIYVSLNTGDHDLDPATPAQGAIYQIRTDPDTGTSYLEYMADTNVTTTNDGTMDPRATKPFGGVDVSAHVMMDNTSLIANTGDSDKLRGAEGEDLIFGGGGQDIIHAGADNDQVSGDQGADLIFGGQGDDILTGGEANDTVEGGQGADQLHGDNGNDILNGDAGNDMLQGGYGDDQAFGGDDDDSLDLGQGDDWAFGGAGDDDLDGGSGSDHLDGGSGDDIVFGADGMDFVKGAGGDDLVQGGAGDDRGYGGDGADLMAGGDGADRMIGNAGADTIYGNSGADTLKGGGDVDILFGGGQSDMLFGGNDDDQLNGDAGDDRIVGGAGTDIITGGAGDDHLWGGAFIEDNTADVFVYASGGGQDMVHDFETDLDRIDLSSYGMTFEELQARFADLGWGTEIDLSDLSAAGDVDRIILRSITLDDLGEDNFIL